MRVFLAAACMLVVGCTNLKSQNPKKVLRLNFTRNVPTFDPRKGGDTVSSAVQFMLFEGLTGMTESSTNQLSLAEKVEVSDDYKTYRFTLKNLKWSNGLPITAYDFELSWKQMLSPDFPAPNAFLLFPIKNATKAKNHEVSLDEVGIHAIDDLTLVVELENPTPYFTELTSFCALFPVAYDKAQSCPYHFDAPTPDFPVSGAFKIRSWKPGYELILEKNPFFHAHENVEIDEIRISFVADDMTAFHLFENGELDLCGGFFGDIPYEEAERLKSENRIEKVAIGSTTFLSLNLDKFPFHNAAIRKSLFYILNRKAIIKNILQFDETTAMGCIPPFMKKNMMFDPSDDGNLSKGIEAFEQGLHELHLDRESFPELTLTVGISNLHHRVALAIQDQLQEQLNIKVKLEPLDLKVYLDKINSKKHSMALCMSVIQYHDIMNILERFKYKSNPKNFSGFESLEYRKLLELSSLSHQIDYRLQYLIDAEKLLIDDASVIGVYHSHFIFAKHPRVSGFYVSPIGSMHVNYIRLNSRH